MLRHHLLARTPLPFAPSRRHVRWQTMAQLSRQHAQLSAMVRLVRYKITEKMCKIGGKVLPGSRRNRAAARYAEPDQFDHAFTAACERSQQLRRSHRAAIHGLWHLDSVACADHLDPHAPGVVNVRRKH